MKKSFIGVFVAIMFGLGSMVAQAQVDPETVIRSLYRAADTKAIAEMTRTELLRYFDEELSNAIWNAANDENGLDFDILYNAQDNQIKNFRISKASPQTALLSYWNVSFTNFGKKTFVNFELMYSKTKGWKISEITYADSSTLSNILLNLN